GKDCSLELLLGHLKQEIRLVFREIATLLEHESAGVTVVFHARVVASGDPLGADFTRYADKPGELQLRVTRHTRDGSPAGEVVFNKRANHRALELFLEVEHVKRYAQIVSYASGVVNVVKRTASRRLRLLIGREPSPLIPQLHREADYVMPLSLENCGCD